MDKGIISTGSHEATNAAAEILNIGGNAFDAAVSAVFTSMTSEFALTGVGGGGAMMVSIPEAEPVIYDFFVNTPSKINNEELDFFDIEVDFGDSKQNFNIGKGSAAVPGTLLGLITIQKKFGVLPLSAVLEPAIYLARKGSILNKQQAYIFKLLEPIFSLTSLGKELFYSERKILEEGDRFINADFANFLEIISREGSDVFYIGEIARLIENDFNVGGLLNRKVLSEYKVAVRRPVMTSYMDTQVYSNPAPSIGGTLIIFLLRLIEERKIKNIQIPELIHAMAVTNRARYDICTDFNDIYQVNRLLEKETFSKYLEKFCFENISISDNDSSIGRGETTHVSIIDKDQNAASVTTTNGEGCGYILPGTGIMLNNMLGEQDLNPQGFHKWNNSMRLPTMISPTIIMKKKKPFILLGSGGSNRIRSAIIQVIVNYINRGKSLDEAILFSRVHLEQDQLYFEPGIINSEIILPDYISLNPFKDKNIFFGGVNAVTLTEGVSDIRRGGISKII